VKPPILSITKGDVTKYLEDVKRTKNGVIENHMARILATMIKENIELQKSVLQQRQEIQMLIFERADYEKELRLLRTIARDRKFRRVK